LDGLGKLDMIADAYERRVAMAKQYAAGTLILTGSRESRDALNTLIREELARKGELSRESARRYELSHADEDGVKHAFTRELAVGDKVAFLENEYKRYDVRNGELGTVTRTEDGVVGIRLEDGREISVDVARYSALEYGYALTTYKSQGQTYDRVVVEADTEFAQLQDQRNCYVQITRARDDVKIYTDDREALRDLAGVLTVKQDTLDLKPSLSQAVSMERRVREEALGLRARSEAQAKIIGAELNAHRDAEALTDASLPEVRVYNTRLVADAGKSEVLRAACLEQLKTVETQLLARQDLALAEMRRVAEYLAQPSSARVFDAYLSAPDRVIAVGLLGSGVRAGETATDGLTQDGKESVRAFVGQDSFLLPSSASGENGRAPLPRNRGLER
jgi:hypothetical protein